MAITTEKNIKSKKCFVAIHPYVDTEDPENSECTMVNDTETVERVCEEMKEVTGKERFIDSHYCNNCGEQIDGEGSALDVYSDRILAAHERKIAEKDAEIVRLRDLVGELTNALETINTKLDFDPSIGFKWTISDEEFESLHTGALVARAKEAIGGATL